MSYSSLLTGLHAAPATLHATGIAASAAVALATAGMLGVRRTRLSDTRGTRGTKVVGARQHCALQALSAAGEPRPFPWKFCGIGQRESFELTAFLDHLDALPRSAWLALDASVCKEGRCCAERALLDARTSDRRLQLAAWLVRAAVNDTVSTREGSSAAEPSLNEPQVERVRAAALYAAQALLLRPFLPTSEFEYHYAPFIELIPPSSLTPG